MSRITESAVRLRLDPANWPENLDRKELSAPFGLSKSIEVATEVFNQFEHARRMHAANAKLTPLGAKAATAEFAEAHLPALRERLEKLRQSAAQAESSLIAKLTSELSTPTTEPADVALMQEIRAWLRSLPELERLNKARQLANAGDKTALRAILTAPTYLTGVNEELLGLIRDEVARRAHPERHAKLEAFRKAADVAGRAVEGVIRYIEQETRESVEPLVHSSSTA